MLFLHQRCPQTLTSLDQVFLPVRKLACSTTHPTTICSSHSPQDQQASNDRTKSGRFASSSKPVAQNTFPMDIEDDENKADLRRKTQILMEILTAGERIEQVIAQYSDDIDEQMLDLVDKRTKTASRMKEGDKALGGLALVKRRLRAEIDNRDASPSQRLLNGLLEIMTPEFGVMQEEQEEEVGRILRHAFQPAPLPSVDIFQTAARLARGEEVEDIAPNEDGHVPQHVFVAETEQLVLQAARNLADLERSIAKGNLGRYDAAYRHALGVRQQALQQVRAILEVARRV